MTKTIILYIPMLFCMSMTLNQPVDKPILLSLKGLAKAEVLSYIVPGMQVASSLNVEVAPV